jgi:hypothetical protein
MNWQRRGWLAVVVVGFLGTWWAASASAAEQKASATGTWKSTFTTQNGDTIVTTYKLKQAGEKLTGTVTRQGQEARKIQKGKVKDGQVSFEVTGERNGQKFTVHFSGKLAADSITGKLEFEGDNGKREFDWTAKREK